MLRAKVDIPDDLLRTIKHLDDDEVKELLQEVADSAFGPDGILHDHFQEGQATWPDQDPEYVKAKGGKPKFVNSGAALKAIKNPKDPNRKTTISAKSRTLKITIRKMKGGVNVYNIVQRGRFQGVKLHNQDGSVERLDADEAHKRNARLTSEYKTAKQRGFKGSYKSFLKKNSGSSRSQRLSSGGMPVTQVLPGDDEKLYPHVVDALENMLKKRGLIDG